MNRLAANAAAHLLREQGVEHDLAKVGVEGLGKNASFTPRMSGVRACDLRFKEPLPSEGSAHLYPQFLHSWRQFAHFNISKSAVPRTENPRGRGTNGGTRIDSPRLTGLKHRSRAYLALNAAPRAKDPSLEGIGGPAPLGCRQVVRGRSGPSLLLAEPSPGPNRGGTRVLTVTSPRPRTKIIQCKSIT